MFRSLLGKLQTGWGALGFLIILSLLSAGAFFLLSAKGTQEEKQEPVPFDGILVERAPIDRKINRHVEIVRKESLPEGLANLSFPEMFFWPTLGMFEEGMRWVPMHFPLAPVVGRYDVPMILSNRRFLKVYRELSDLPRDQTVKLLKEHILEGTKSHKKYLEDCIELVLPDAKKNEYVSLGTLLMDTGKPTREGMRFKVLSLVLIAGNLDLTEVFSDIASVVHESRRQYEVIRKEIVGSMGKNSSSMSMGYLMVRDHSLYHRQILATGLLKTAPDNPECRALRKKYAGHWKTAKLTHYDAEYTPYDIFSSRGFVGADYTKGEMTLGYLGNPLSDEEFDHIVNTLLPANEKKQGSK